MSMIIESVWSNVGMTMLGESGKYLKKTFQNVKFVHSHVWPEDEPRP